MKKYILSVTFFFIFKFFLFSQEIIKGYVIHQNTLDPIVNANVYLNNTSIGTITNEDGQFILIIPKELENSSVIFTSLGFESQNILASNLLVNKEVVVKLASKEILLEEVVVSANKTKISASEIVKKSFENYYDNFPQQDYIAKGFVRHTEKTDNDYKWLVEGSLEMYYSTTKKNSDVKINVLETRKSLDNRVLDTAYVVRTYLRDNNNASFKRNFKNAENYKKLGVAELEKAFTFYDNHYTSGYNRKQGLLEKIITSDINKIGNYNKKDASFQDDSLNKFSFEIDTILGFSDDKIYKLKFSRLHKKDSKLDVGYLYIKGRNYAIIEIEYNVLLGESNYYRKVTGENILYSTNIKFKEFQAKYYPFYISHKSYKINNPRALFEKNTNTTISGNISHQEILFSEIINKKEEVENLSSNSNLWNDNLFFKKPYNAAFWNNYNILLESKEQKLLIEDLVLKIKLKK